MDQPGVETRPLREMTGRAMFNEVFIDGARVPDWNMIGGLNNGWAVANTTLAHERGTAFPFKEQVVHEVAEIDVLLPDLLVEVEHLLHELRRHIGPEPVVGDLDRALADAQTAIGLLATTGVVYAACVFC
jgi:hypothetical protein